MASLPVYFEQRHIGTIHVDRSGPSFTYASGWIGLRGAFPISITMPLRSKRFGPDTFLPWAANLLPESEQLRTLGATSWDGAKRRHWSAIRDRRRHRRCPLFRSSRKSLFGPMATGQQAGRT